MRTPKIELTDAIMALEKQKQPDIVVQTRQYRLITPLFGGGVTPNQVDEITPIRGTAIRGHLRFWWRATRGGQFGKDGLKAMKAREDEIWGAASTSSSISVAVSYPNDASRMGTTFQDTHKKKGHSVATGDPSSKTGYVAFPLRKTANQATANKVIEGIAFTLTVSFLEINRVDVEAALWAWETFGGIGARTRRGFGALECFSVVENGHETDPRYAVANIKTNMENSLTKHLAGQQFPDHLPHLSPTITNHLAITNTSGSSNAVNVWINLIEALQNFRHKRPQNGNRPGRNRWPEPDAIRDKVNPRNRRYSDTIHTPPIDKVPRAAFGLPIIFEFKDESTMQNVTLKGADNDRFASPLIIRPLACQNDQYVGIALILAGSDVNDIPGGLILDGVRGNPPITAKLTTNEAAQIAAKAKIIDPNDTYNGNPDILQAFLDTL